MNYLSTLKIWALPPVFLPKCSGCLVGVIFFISTGPIEPQGYDRQFQDTYLCFQ